MKVLVGLGNPGLFYQRQRHNLGFMFIDAVGAAHGLPACVDRFHCQLTSWQVDDEKILVAKPQTFMNNSGAAVYEIVSYYKLTAADVYVVHDDLDLQFLDTRFKIGGGNAGHRGLNSIDIYLGKNYHRLRIGIGRPEFKEQVSDYVLMPFFSNEQQQITKLLDQAAKHVKLLFSEQPRSFITALQADRKVTQE